MRNARREVNNPGKRSRAHPLAQVWVVCHCELFKVGGSHWVDEMVFCSASSRQAAEHLIRSTVVDAGTWWRVFRVTLDELEEDDRPAFYSCKGRVISTPPYRQAHARLSRKGIRSRGKRT